MLGIRLRDAHGQVVGKVTDLVVTLARDSSPDVTGVVIRRSRDSWFLSRDWLDWSDLAAPARTLPDPPLAPLARRAGELWLAHDLRDHQVIDLADMGVERVNDVVLERDATTWRVHGVDAGSQALLRRLLPPRFRPGADESRVLPWPRFEIFASEIADRPVQPDHRRLADLHPADIARIADLVPTQQALEIIESLPEEQAADTLEEMSEDLQGSIFTELDLERAAAILSRMAPNAAADVLAELPQSLVDHLLAGLAPAAAADLHALLTFAKDTAGGLMTTDYALAPRTLPVREAPEFLRAQMKKPDWVYYVYIVEEVRERTLLGVVSLRDLFLAGPDQTMEEIMTKVLRTARPDAPASRVAQTMSEYNLAALPVIDREGRLLGIVSVDDALAVILPANLRRSLPRVFS